MVEYYKAPITLTAMYDSVGIDGKLLAAYLRSFGEPVEIGKPFVEITDKQVILHHDIVRIIEI